jgi:hypothetical protein
MAPARQALYLPYGCAADPCRSEAMSKFLSNIHVLALGAGVTFAGLTPGAASPLFVAMPIQAQSGVIRVQDSATIIRKEAHHDGGWKKRRHHREIREARRDRWRDKVHDHDGRGRHFRPKATPKYAYDAYGDLRVYDDDGWKRHRKWDGDHEKHKRRVRVARRTFTSTVPSPELQEILTAVPD